MSTRKPTPSADSAPAGAAYVACRPLYDKQGACLAEAGATCERVPPVSLPWLLADGHIVPASPAPAEEGR